MGKSIKLNDDKFLDMGGIQGGSIINAFSGVDADSLVNNGIYYIGNNPSNIPVSYGHLHVTTIYNEVLQIYFPLTQAKIYRRFRNSSNTWSAWTALSFS